ncbi:MAG: ABC transporter permease subunit [Armatimonadetes bacterium]|nr:ABC transporter permease subunit [Armatimonadota bacterium]
MNIIASARERTVNTFADSIYDNAVVVKEFRTRMRGWKAFAVMGGYILLLGIVMGFALMSIVSFGSASSYSMTISNRRIGMELFAYLAITQVILLTLVLPSLTAGSITGELEKRTIEMLALTNLTAGKVVLGKQLSGFLYALVLLVCSIPLAGLCLMFGGISPSEIAITYCIIAAWAFMFTSAGVLWSSLFNKTAAATLCSYGTCIGYMLLTIPLGIFVIQSLFMHGYGSGTGLTFVFGAINPAFAPYISMLQADICGTNISIALVAIVMMILAGWLMMLLATGHVRYQKADHPLAIRLLVLTISALIAFLIAGNMSFLSTLGPVDVKIFLAVIAIFILVILGLGVTAFATGQIKNTRGASILYGLSPFKIFKSDLGGSAAFMFLWMLITYGAFGLGLFLGKRSGLAGLGAGFLTMYWHIGCAMLFTMIGFSAVGIFFSALAGSKRAAVGLTTLFLVIMLGGYGVMLIGYTGEPASPIMQLAPLWPIAPIVYLVNDRDSLPKLYCQGGDEWLATSAAYIIITLIALNWAGVLHSKGRGIKEED